MLESLDSESGRLVVQDRHSGEETAGLVVRYRGGSSSGQKPILLVAHLDVVDALPQDWERDPFTMIEEDAFFFGRDTLDDKFGVTMLTATFLRLKAEGFVPTQDLIIAFTGDEEDLDARNVACVAGIGDGAHSVTAVTSNLLLMFQLKVLRQEVPASCRPLPRKRGRLHEPIGFHNSSDT